MTRFIRTGRFIINIDAIAKIEDMTAGDNLIEINVNLTNGDYLVLRDQEARAVLDFFQAGRKDRSGFASRTEADLPPCTTL